MSIFIIAEAGINHNGSVEIAERLIDVAKDCGADAVKFQKRTIDLVYDEEFLARPRKSPWGTTQREQKEALELSEDDYARLDAYCREKEIDWFASAWDIESYEFLRSFDPAHSKVASAMITDVELLEAIAADGRHTFISTGMGTPADIERAVEIFRAADCPFELMHCVSIYPTPDEETNLAAIPALRGEYGCDVGYSGHEVGIGPSLEAAALGITSLERHITLEREMYGSDQAASLEPDQLRELIAGVRQMQHA